MGARLQIFISAKDTASATLKGLTSPLRQMGADAQAASLKTEAALKRTMGDLSKLQTQYVTTGKVSSGAVKSMSAALGQAQQQAAREAANFQLQGVAERYQKFGTVSAASLGRAQKALEVLGGSTKATGAHVDRLGKSAQTAGGHMAGMHGRATGLAGALDHTRQMALGMISAMLIMRGLDAVISTSTNLIVGFNARLEQSKIAWDTMLGGPRAATQMLKELKIFASKTPFEFPELEAASRKLLAWGFNAKDIIPVMTDLGNAASALGLDKGGLDRLILAFGQVRTLGRLQGQEVRQLAEVGFPVYKILAGALGQPQSQIKGMIENGEISAKIFLDAFRGYVQANWGNMMQRQSRTLLGAWSTIKDNFLIVGSQMFETAFARLAAFTDRVAQFTMTPQFEAWGNRAGQILEKLLSAGIRGVRDLKAGWDSMTDRGRLGILTLAGLMIAGGPLMGAISGVGKAIWGLGTAFNGAILKASILVGVAASVGSALEAAMGVIQGGDFVERFKSNMAQVGRNVEEFGLRLAGSLGAPKELIQTEQGILDLSRELHDLEPAETSLATQRMIAAKKVEEATKRYNEAVAKTGSQRDWLGRPLEFGDIYKPQEEALRQLNAAKAESSRLDQAGLILSEQRQVREQILADLESKRGGALLSGIAESAGGLAEWVGDVTGFTKKIRGLLSTTTTAAEDTGDALAGVADEAEDLFDPSAGTAGKNALQRALDTAREMADDLRDALGRAKDKMSELARTPLLGEGQLDQRKFNLDQQIAAVQLKITNLKMRFSPRNVPESVLRPLEQQMEKLQLAAQKVDLEGKLKFDPLRRKIDEMVNQQKELTFGAIIRGLKEQREQMALLEPKLTLAEQLVKSLEKAYKALGDAVSTTAAIIQKAPIPVPQATDWETRHLLVEPRASGGPVTAGQSYIVGEKRAELFVPSTSGVILPSARTGSAGGSSSAVNLTYAPVVNVSGGGNDIISTIKAVLKEEAETMRTHLRVAMAQGARA